MKFYILPIFGAIFALLLCSCSSFEVTKSVDQALAHVEEGIEYHDRAYMEKRDLRVPNGVDEKNLGELKFNFAFKQGTEVEDGEAAATNWNRFTKNEWNAFRREFENAVGGTKRFPIAQMLYGLADDELRRKSNNGVANVKELDPSALKESAGIFHITPLRTNSFNLAKKEKRSNYTLKLVVNPLAADNNSPLDEIQPFSVQIGCEVNQLTDRAGRVIAGLRLSDRSKRDEFNIKLSRAVIVQFLNKMYNLFPTGGAIVNYEDGQFVLRGSRATGIQPNMEFVVYAMRKGNPDAMRVAICNATAESVGQTGNTTLTIWRKSEKVNAKKIMRHIEADFSSALDEYDIYACSDGFAQWPDFIDRSTSDSGN